MYEYMIISAIAAAQPIAVPMTSLLIHVLLSRVSGLNASFPLTTYISIFGS
ncbi:hypothetical protein [uncultured Paenibacillus sp.]|uniref:hypothetical protein n=1 Tax=uncultured Paenibacillus sp. TaxID=227322 RepID=UPI0025D7D57C|nr:hypothetical protein [uncultured Paenibacillus sp.]